VSVETASAQDAATPAAARTRRRSALPSSHLLDIAIATVVLVVLCAPALFTSNGFVDDWVNHLWLTWMQSREIRATGHPSIFLNADPLGAFYPNFAFYGGTLYAIGGYLMVLTGAPVAVFVAMLVGAFIMAYGATLWLGRQAGIAGLAAHLPATIVVTGAYYLSLAYGRGSWPELVATSAIPVMLAAAVNIVRRGLSARSVLALGVATTIWSGSHNITFAWGSIFLAGVSACLLLSFGPRLGSNSLKRLAIVLGVAGLGVLVNGWFLLPDVAYSLRTGIAQAPGLGVSISDLFNPPSVVFDPLRHRASDSAYLRSHFTELPVFVMVWLAVAAALLWRARVGASLRWLFALLTALTFVLVVLILDDKVWQKLPSTLALIQFTFRLQTYVVMALAGLVIVVLRALRDTRPSGRARGLTAGLVAVTAFGFGVAVWQVWNSDAGYFPDSPKVLADRSNVLDIPHHTPPTWYDPGQFRDGSDIVVPTHGAIHLDVSKITGGRTSQAVTIPPGQGPVATNIGAGPYLVTIGGLRVAGRGADGFLALERPPDGRTSVQLTVSTASTAPLRLGPVLTILSIAALAAAAMGSGLHARRRRRATSAVQSP
jgi:hypothetical protein